MFAIIYGWPASWSADTFFRAMYLPIYPSFCCLLLSLACAAIPATAADTATTYEQQLLAALDVSKNAEVILCIAAQTHEFREGKEISRAEVTALLSLDGSESRAVLAYTPYVQVNPTRNSQSNKRCTFNGRYWAMATYDLGNVGDIPSLVKELRITQKAHPFFNGYRRSTALELCLPFARFHEGYEGAFNLLQLLKGYKSYEWTFTEEKRGDANLLKVTVQSGEWMLLDPARNFVVLEKVREGADWREETKALKVTQTSCGLWFATDYVFVYSFKGEEKTRTETYVTDVTLSNKATLEKELEPRYGRGWKVKDERTKQQYLIQDDAEEIFKKLDAVAP